MRFAILGPLRVEGPEGTIELKAHKQRALLALLLLSGRDGVVSVNRLIDALWDQDPPPTAGKALQVNVSQLRRALGAETIITQPSGYAVALEPGALDLEHFEALVARSRRELPELAAELLREALALFRGPPLSDVLLYGPAAGEVARLADLRLATLEQRVDLELELMHDRHSELVTELEVLTAEHPYRERFHAQLMLALYRAGRQADALDAYRRARDVLVDDLGLEPSPALKRLEAAILAHDPALEIPGSPATGAGLAAPPAAGFPGTAPAAPSPAAPALPLLPAPLLGRADDLVTATALLADPTVRLLTLTGPGGIGKTRFALELAHQLAPRFADGARFVALGALDDPARVPAEIGQAIGDDPLAALLVIDNFEQILPAAGEVGALLAAHPGAKVVVTSRAPLRLAAEHELALGPLDAAPAAALFLRRARAVDPRLALEGGDEERIEQICARLDGMPLAIELAAAGSKVLSPASILERLGRRLDLLSTGPRDVPARQQTLRGAIGWSYDLLDEPGRRLFSELAVFSGGFTVEAAEAVCGPEAFDGIARLLDQSLLTRNGRRFGMLETVREYALERLAQSGALDSARDRHARAFAAITADAESGLHSAEIEQWLLRLDADRDNMLAALLHATATRDVDTALALVVASWRWWVTRGVVAEGGALAEAALAVGEGSPELRMRAVNGAGVLAAEMGDFTTARLRFEESVRLAGEVGADERMARSKTNLANLATYEGDFETAIRLHSEALATAERMGNHRAQSVTLQNLGIAYDGAGDRERGIATLERALAMAHRAADPAHLTSTQRTLARFLLELDSDRALLLLRESLIRSSELADRNAIVECLETAAAAAGGRGDPHTGALLLGAAEALRTDAGAIRQPDEEAWFADTETTLRTALGEPAYTTARTQGAALSTDEAVTHALAV